MARGTTFLGSVAIGLSADPRRFLTGAKKADKASRTHQYRISQLRHEYFKVARAARRAQNDFIRNASLTLATAFGIARLVDQYKRYDAAIIRQRALVGLSINETERLRAATINLSRVLGRGPTELAEGLFFITSAGLRGAAAVQALEASTKAAAIGLGEVRVVADAVTTVLNAYGTANINAAQAAAVLVATVREGKIQAEQLAPQLGRVISLAAILEVEFHEVGAALAVLSRSQEISLATTSLIGILRGLVKPSVQARDALANRRNECGGSEEGTVRNCCT